MSFLKCLILATEKLHISNLITTKVKGQAMISNKQKFYAPENQNNRKIQAETY